MRVIAATPARRFTVRRAAIVDSRAARIERLGLFAVSLVIALGLWLVYSEQLRTFSGCRVEGAAANGSETECINLGMVGRAADLAPALRVFNDPAERTAVAAAIVSRLYEHPQIDHVGSLASMTIPAATVRGQKNLLSLNERLASKSSLTELPILTSSELTTIKPSLIVRTAADYERQALIVALMFMLAFWATHVLRAWAGTTGDPILLPADGRAAGPELRCRFSFGGCVPRLRSQY